MTNYVTKFTNIWTGVVEDTKDPLNLGRCKVRVFGVHSDNLKEVPTSTLPWATPLSSSNSAKSFSTLVEGDYVVGYFQDGSGSQVPVILGVMPAIPSKIFNTSKGFSPQSLDPIKTDLPPGQAAAGVGVPSTPPGARGDYANTAIAQTNKTLDHSCDFRYQINIDLGLGTFINPVTAIEQAIKSGKNKSAMLIRLMLGQLNDDLRTVIKSIIATIGLDPSGEFSKQYSIAKDIFRKINEITKQVAAYVELASFYTSLVQDITKIVEYLRSLPTRIQAVIQECIFNFLKSVDNFATQLKAIPGTVQGGATNILNQLTNSTKTTLSTVTASAAAIPVTPALSSIINSPTTTSVQTITTYISTTYANTATTLANSKANSYDKTKTQSP
jgi:hypothetical protein